VASCPSWNVLLFLVCFSPWFCHFLFFGAPRHILDSTSPFPPNAPPIFYRRDPPCLAQSRKATYRERTLIQLRLFPSTFFPDPLWNSLLQKVFKRISELSLLATRTRLDRSTAPGMNSQRASSEKPQIRLFHSVQFASVSSVQKLFRLLGSPSCLPHCSKQNLGARISQTSFFRVFPPGASPR